MDTENLRKFNPVQNDPLDDKITLKKSDTGKEEVNIPGYMAPTEYVPYKGNRRNGGGYKSFNADAIQINDSNKQDAYFSESKVKQLYNFEDEYCPKCSEVSQFTCPCGYSDKKCSNGHVWYTDRETNRIKIENPHL